MTDYQLPGGLHVIPDHLLDQRPDAAVDERLLNPAAVTDERNVWFFWHQGFERMYPCAKRNVRAWYRRLSKHGWVIRVMDRVPGSPMNIGNFLDAQDPENFPQAFIDGNIGGDYALQHTSDLVRWPLLLRYGGVYADVGMMQIGDLERVWSSMISNPDSPYEVLSYNCGSSRERSLANYFLCASKKNPLFARCHKLLLKLWEGKYDTEGMHRSLLLPGMKMMMEGQLTFAEGHRTYSPEESSRMLTDYIIQGHVMTLVMSLIDAEDGWNGPEYCAKHIYAIEYMKGSQLINELTAWNGPEAFRLMSLPLPKHSEHETEDQQKARNIVERCLSESFGFKLAHGIIIRMLGETLGSLWRNHEGSDNVPGTYAHWLRYGMNYWNQDALPVNQDWEVLPPVKVGPLLRER